MADRMLLPPCLTNDDDRPRRVGVEIEFGGISCEAAARLVCDLFGGSMKVIDSYKFEVAGTPFGTFEVELDSKYAHPEGGPEENARRGTTSEWVNVTRQIKDGLSTMFAEVAGLWLPVEIVTPPIPLDRLPDLERIIDGLRAAGAEDTTKGLLYAFATQFNPEVPSLEASSLLRHLRAFLLLADSLRTRIDVDPLRRALPFAQPFTRSYAAKVLDPAYQPDLSQLVVDYVEANPTRNRELDMLPVFAHVAPELVFEKLDDDRIKARPTFHYRLPDTRISDPGWGVIVEWNRWAEIEWLAADEIALDALGIAFVASAETREWQDFSKAIETWRAGSASAP